MGVAVAVQRCGEAAVEVPEGAHALQRTQALQGAQMLAQAFMLETLLLVLHIGDHGLHEVRLVDAGETQADAIGALVQAKRHRHRDRLAQRAADAAFAQV